MLFQPGNGLVLPQPRSDRAELDPWLHRGGSWIWGDADQPAQNQVTITLNLSKGNGAAVSVTLPAISRAGNPAAFADGGNAELGSPASPPLDDRNLPTSPSLLINGSSANIMLTPIEGTVVQNSGMTMDQAQLVFNPANQHFYVMTQASSPNKPAWGWNLIGANDNDKLWFGWMRTVAGGPVRGVVLSWTELAKFMKDSFPEKVEDPADAFVLYNPQHEVVASAGEDPATHPAFHGLETLPLAAAGMPGWQLKVFFNPTANFTSGFTAVSTIMVTILVVAVLIGGTLLMREARREASEAARKTSFVSNVSHELKTPLTTIRMYAELLGEGRVRDQLKQNNYLATIIAESQRLTRLVNNVLDFSRLEQGRKQYHPADVALTPIIDAVINAQKPRLDEAGFTLGCSYPASPPVRVHADRDALEQVLLNLIDNALKYAASGRWIGIHVTTDADFAYVAVSDRGPGVPLDHRERIFETFHRVDDSITASQPGAGLGLSIARRLLRDQEGDLTYQSHEPHGASFVAKVPLAAAISAAKIA